VRTRSERPSCAGGRRWPSLDRRDLAGSSHVSRSRGLRSRGSPVRRSSRSTESSSRLAVDREAIIRALRHHAPAHAPSRFCNPPSLFSVSRTRRFPTAAGEEVAFHPGTCHWYRSAGRRWRGPRYVRLPIPCIVPCGWRPRCIVDPSRSPASRTDPGRIRHRPPWGPCRSPTVPGYGVRRGPMFRCPRSRSPAWPRRDSRTDYRKAPGHRRGAG
jgi:hypothetical protein